MKPLTQQPLAVASADIVELARQSRDRAIAARQAATELTYEDAATVGGGLLIAGPFPWGVLPYLKYADMFKTATTSPAGTLTVPTDLGGMRSF